MFAVLIQALILASGGILSVGSISIVILLLISEGGWRNGLAYMLGYLIAYTVIGLVIVSIGVNSSNNDTQDASIIPSLLFTILGVFLLCLTQRNWRKPPSDKEETPRIFKILDGITPLRALVLGAAVTVINAKNLAIFLSAVSVVYLRELQMLTKIVIVLLIVIVFCSAVIAPVLIYLLFPSSAINRLTRFRNTLSKHSRAIGIWVPLIFGFIFLARGLVGLL